MEASGDDIVSRLAKINAAYETPTTGEDVGNGSFEQERQKFEAESQARLRAIAEALGGGERYHEIEPYGGAFGFFPALAAGVAEGIPSTVGGTLSGVGIFAERLGGYLTPGVPDDAVWEGVGQLMQKGGNWIQENVHLLSEEQRLRLQATQANPFFENDGRPAWKMGSWVTGADGEWNLGRRMAEVGAKAGAGIGETIPLVASMFLPGGALKLLGAGQKVASLGGAAMNLGGMVALQANEGMKQMENEGVDTDILKDAAMQYGVTSGPVEYVQTLLSSKLVRGAFEKSAGKNVGKSIADTVERLLSEKSRLGAVKAAGIEGAEEVGQGWLLNPARDYAYAKMRERYGDDWKPAEDARFTLKDAAEVGMMGAAMGGFFRGVGKVKDMLVSNKKTTQAQSPQDAAAGKSPDPIPVSQDTKDSLSRGHNGPVTMTESDFGSMMSSVVLGAEEGTLGNAQGDSSEYATMHAAWEWAIGDEESKARARKIYSDAMNVSIIPDKFSGEQAQQANEDAISSRNTDQTRALSFLTNDTVIEGKAQTPLVAPEMNRVNSYKKELSYDESVAEAGEDVIARDALGIPVRTDGKVLPAEVEAMREYRNLLGRARPMGISVRKLISRYVSMSEAQAKERGIDTATAPKDTTGNVIVKIGPSIGVTDGKAVLTLPANFTMAEMRHGIMMAYIHPDIMKAEDGQVLQQEAQKWEAETNASGISEYVAKYGNGLEAIAPDTNDAKAWVEAKGTKLNRLISKMGDENTALEVATIVRQLGEGSLTVTDANARINVVASKPFEELDVASARRFNRLFRGGGGISKATKNNRVAFSYAIANPSFTPKMFSVSEQTAPVSLSTAKSLVGDTTKPADVKAPPQTETAEKKSASELEQDAETADAESETDAAVNMATEAISEEMAPADKLDDDIEALSRDVDDEDFDEDEDADEAPRAAKSKPSKGIVGKLPKELAGAKPRYNYGTKAFMPKFESDVDLAAYIASQKTRSKKDAEYLEYAMKATGLTEQQVRSHGSKVRDAIKAIAKDSEGGTNSKPEVISISKIPVESAAKQEGVPLGVGRIDRTKLQENLDAGMSMAEAREAARVDQPKAQTVTIRTPANAENFVSRMTDVTKRMGGTLTMNEDGSLTARFGAYEVIAKPASEQIQSNGQKANASIATTRDIHTNAIVGWQITYDDESTVSTTAAHEVLHASVDLLDASEKNTLAGMFGVSSIQGKNEEFVVEKMAQAIVNETSFGDERSATQIVWDKVKSTLNMMLHLRFGEAWSSVKSLPVELRSAAVTKLITTGEVFKRQAVEDGGVRQQMSMTFPQDRQGQYDAARDVKVWYHGDRDAGWKPHKGAWLAPTEEAARYFGGDNVTTWRIDGDLRGEMEGGKRVATIYDRAVGPEGADATQPSLRLVDVFSASPASNLRYQMSEEQRDDAAVRRKIAAEDKTEGQMDDYEATSRISDAIAKLKQNMADIKAKSYDQVSKVLEDAELQEYIDAVDFASLKDKMAAANTKSQAVKDKLVAKIQELKARAIIAKIVPDMIKLNVGEKNANINMLEDVESRGVYDPSLVQYYDAVSAGNTIAKESVEVVRSAFLKSINEVMIASGMSPYMFNRVTAANMTMEQLSALQMGLLDGISAKLKQYWKAKAKAESRTYGAKITSPEKMDILSYQGYDEDGNEVTTSANEAWAKVLEQMEGKKDWSEWKDIASDLKAIKEIEVKYLKQRRDAARADRMAIEDQIIEDGKKNIEGKDFSKGVLKFGIVKFEMMRSTLGRISPLLKKIFHDDIVEASSKATALIRGSESSGTIHFEGQRLASGLDTQAKQSDAAVNMIPIKIHGEDVQMTLNQKHNLLAQLTDTQRLLVIRQGTDFNFSHQENMSDALSVLKPRNATKLTWYNLKDRGAEKITTDADKRPEGKGLWINVETEQGIADFLAAVTKQDAMVAAANKNGIVPTMNAVNEMTMKEYGSKKFTDKTFPKENPKAQALLQSFIATYRRGDNTVLPTFTFGYTTSRRARTSADAKKFAIGEEFAALSLEELGVQGKRTARYLETPLIIEDIVTATNRSYSQWARIATMQIPMRKAINHLTNIDKRKTDSLRSYLVTTLGGEFVEKDLTGWLQDQIGLSGQSTESTSRFMSAIARNVIVGRLALRASSVFVNRYSSGFITSAVLSIMENEGRIPKGSSASFLKHLAAPMSNKSEESQAILSKLMDDPDTGYFWKRWASDLAKIYTQSRFDEENVIPTKWAMLTNYWQTKAMSLFGWAEKQKAIALYKTLKESGVRESEIVKLVEEVYRTSENPSTKAEESPILRWMKATNISWLAPYVGQTLVTRDILTNSIMQLHTAGTDNTKRANAKRAIIASSVGIIATMAASEAFRMMIRNAIKPEPEDEERDRAKKVAMNMLQEAAATVAPFAGDAAALSLGQMFGLAEKQFADTSLVSSILNDIMSVGPVLGDTVRMVTGNEEEGKEKELKDLTKGAWKAIVALTTASGIPTAGGVDQLGKALIEHGFPATKVEAGKRRAVEVMDDVSEDTTREEFDMMLRDEYNEAIDEGYIDKKKTTFKEFRGAMRRRVEKKLGEEKALELGYKRRKKEKEDGEEG